MDSVARRGPATPEETGRACPYCRFPLKQGVEVVQCAHCSSSHHSDCWDDNRGCAIVACQGGPSAVAGTPQEQATTPLPAAPTPQRTAIDVGTAAPTAPPPPFAPPRAGEFASQLVTNLQTPAAVFSLVVAAMGAVATLAAALIVAVAAPDEQSIIGALGEAGEAGTGTEMLRDAVAFLQAGFDIKEDTEGVGLGGLMPLLFLAFPILGCAAGAWTQHSRIQSLPVARQFLWAALAGLPFALVMLVVGALAGGDEIEPKLGSVFILGLLWGGLGSVLGAWWALRKTSAQSLDSVLPPAATRWARPVLTAAGPLVLMVAVFSVVGAGIWVVQSFREVPATQLATIDEGVDRSKAGSAVENGLFAVEHGVHLAELGALVKFVRGGGDDDKYFAGSPVPVSQERKLGDNPDDPFATGYDYRVFKYSEPLQVWMFIPMVIVLLGAVAFFALYAGFSTARAARAADPLSGMLWGATVGLVWAASMAAVEGLARLGIYFLEPFGRADGDSVFLMFLLVGGVIGAAGGYMSALRPQVEGPGAPVAPTA